MRPLSEAWAWTWAVVLVLGAAPLASAEEQRPLVSEEPTNAGAESGPFTKEFGERVSRTLAKWHVPGLAIAVVDGEHTWTEGYGIATFPSTPVTGNATLFYGASTTKAFVAAALSLMVDSGNYTDGEGAPLGWATPLAAVLRDDFVLQDAWATAHVTIEDALSHRTGVPAHDKSMGRTYPDGSGSGGGRHTATVRDITRSLRHLPPTAEPRARWQYCNLMYAVLSHLVETLTGRWLGDVLREWLWAPLGMRSTYFSLDAALAAPEHFAAGYYWDGDEGEFVRVPYMALEEVSGAGSVVSTAADYARWLRCLLRAGAPLSPSVLKAVKTPKIFAAPTNGPYDTPPSYASGWFTSSYKGHRFWTHAGGMHAYGAEVIFFPDEQYGIVTFANTAITSNIVGQILLWHLVEEKLGIAEDERFPWEAQFEQGERSRFARFASALDIVYPDRARPPLPRALPLVNYTGTYFHPGYENFTLELLDTGKGAGARAGAEAEEAGKLVAERVNYTWPMRAEFEHVSGESWMVYMDMLHERSGHFRDYAGGRFNIGADGRVASLEIDFRFEEGSAIEGHFVFEKIE